MMLMRLIFFEYNKIKKSSITYVLLLVVLAFLICSHYDATESQIEMQGYRVSIGLATLNVLGIFYSIYVGSILFFNDWNWNTYQHMLLTHGVNRVKASILKMIMILLSNLFAILIVLICSVWLHWIYSGDFNGVFDEKVFFQIVLTFFNMSFYGLFSFFVSLSSRSFVLGLMIPFIVFNFESLLYDFLGTDIAIFLPNYHIKALLCEAFTNLKPGAMILFNDIGYHMGFGNYLYLFIATFAIVFGIFRFMNEIEMKS